MHFPKFVVIASAFWLEEFAAHIKQDYSRHIIHGALHGVFSSKGSTLAMTAFNHRNLQAEV